MDNTNTGNHSPIKFFLLVLVLSIPFWLLGVLVKGATENLPIKLPISALMAFCPLLAAAILVYKKQKTQGVKELLLLSFDFKKITDKRWYAPIVFLMPVIALLSYWYQGEGVALTESKCSILTIALPLDIPITDIMAAFTPLIAASFLVYKEEGRMGVNKLFKRIFDYSRITQKVWYVPIVFLPFLIYLLIFLIIYLLKLPYSSNFQETFLSITVLFIFFFLGAIAEEVGYMGYAIDPMQNRFGALKASIIMGIPWVIWHYPSIIQQGHNAFG